MERTMIVVHDIRANGPTIYQPSPHRGPRRTFFVRWGGKGWVSGPTKDRGLKARPKILRAEKF